MKCSASLIGKGRRGGKRSRKRKKNERKTVFKARMSFFSDSGYIPSAIIGNGRPSEKISINQKKIIEGKENERKERKKLKKMKRIARQQ
jgi:hypothetical protein